MLTQEDLTILRSPFAIQEHKFLNGKVYLAEKAVITRLEDVDPSFSFVIQRSYTRDHFAIVEARMTMKDVSRDGIGMFPLTLKTKAGEIIDAAEPEKSAATDALRRCARLFGVGRYLLEAKNVKDHHDLERWLSGDKNAPPSPQKPPSSDFQQNIVSEVVTPENGLKSPNSNYSEGVTQNWADAFQHLMKYPTLVEAIPQNNQRANTLNKLHKAGQFNGASFAQAIEIILNRPDKAS